MMLRSWALALGAVLGAVVLGWVSTDAPGRWDWTDAGRHTLSPASRALITRFDGPIEITAFVAPDPQTRRAVADLVDRFREAKADLILQFVDPKQHPDQARAADVAAGGELVLRHGDRLARIRIVDEAHFSAALLQLASDRARWVAFVTGHGERAAHGQANHDLGQFVGRLGQRGVRVQTLDLGQQGVIPDNTDLVVVSAPQQAWSSAELKLLTAYIERGGNLLWLADPGDQSALAPLADALGVHWLNGVVLSARSAQLGLDNPAFLVTGLAADARLRTAKLEPVLLPVAAALVNDAGPGWHVRPLLRSDAQSWTETGDLDARPLRFNPERGEQRGPLSLGLALTRVRGPREQRVAVLGDGDFLSNAYLANGANLDLGVALLHWLAGDDALAGVTTARAKDLHLQLDRARLALLAWGFPFVLPTLLVVVGFGIQRLRRRH